MCFSFDYVMSKVVARVSLCGQSKNSGKPTFGSVFRSLQWWKIIGIKFKPIWLQGKHKTKYKTRAHKAFHRGAVKQVEEIQIITIIVVSIL